MIGNVTTILMNVPATLIALSVHELAHGYVSYKLGDPTAKMQGRLTLNPFAHLDLVGTLLMVFTGFGWAKPVPINPMYYKDRTKGMAITAAAGPVSNFILAFVGMFIGVLLSVIFMRLGVGIDTVGWVLRFTSVFTQLNLCFMVFNLIPFPPLDGFKIFGTLLPRSFYYKVLQYEQYIIYILMLLSISGVFSSVIGRGVSFFYSIIYNAVDNMLGLFF